MSSGFNNSILLEQSAGVQADAETRTQRAQFEQNTSWLALHANEVYSKYRGQCICIAGQEVFAADSAQDALAKATAAHPDDRGRFVHYIPRDKLPRIYAY